MQVYMDNMGNIQRILQHIINMDWTSDKFQPFDKNINSFTNNYHVFNNISNCFQKCLFWGEESFHESYLQYQKASVQSVKSDWLKTMIKIFISSQR